jgi:hypothetical protein
MKTYFLVDPSPNNKTLTPQFLQHIKSKVTQLIDETEEYTFHLDGIQLDEIKSSTFEDELLIESPSQLKMPLYRSTSHATLNPKTTRRKSVDQNSLSALISQHHSLNNDEDQEHGIFF